MSYTILSIEDCDFTSTAFGNTVTFSATQPTEEQIKRDRAELDETRELTGSFFDYLTGLDP